MLHLDLSADVTGASRFLNELRTARAAKAVRQALNDAALASRDAVRKDMPRRFTIRRPWVVRGIGVEFARSDNLRAAVYSRDTFMRDQEEGATRRGMRSRAIPMGRVRDMHRSRVIPKDQRPQALMGRKNTFYHAGMLFERRGKGRIEALYMFRKQAKIPARFGMAETVHSEALKQFRQNFERRLWQALGE